MISYEEKIIKLKEIIKKVASKDFAVAFSGGVDSSLLLALSIEEAKKTHVTVYAVTVNTSLHTVDDLETAKKVATDLGAKHIVINIDELSNEEIKNNPKDRCYICKKMLFSSVLFKLKDYGVTALIEGTNYEDTFSYRPGIRAIEELGIISPLKEALFMKEEVRSLAKSLNVEVHNRPSTPCLATRFPYGASLDYDKLRKVEQAELILKEYYAGNVRARIHDRLVRIEVDKNAFPIFIDNMEEISKRIKSLGYRYVTLDLEGFRSGSWD